MSRFFFNHRIGSICGALFFTFWIVQRIYFNRHWLFEVSIVSLTWWLITFQFVIFVVAYLTRSQARVHAHGLIETVFPFFCAAMPFALLVDYPLRPRTFAVIWMLPLSKSMLLGGTLMIIAGVMQLRKSFSIMTEVRNFVSGGIYRYTRHPMYLGSILTTTGVLLQQFSWANILLYLLFCCCQIYRAKREEHKITTMLPCYADYAARVGWIGRWIRR